MLKSVVSPQSQIWASFGPVSCVCSLAHTTCLWDHTQGASCEVGVYGAECMECWGSLWVSWLDVQAWSPQWLVGKPLDGVHDAIGRLVPSPGCWSLSCSSPHPPVTTPYSGCSERDLGICGSFLQSWGSWVLTPHLTFSGGRKDSCVLGGAVLGEG